MKKIIALFLFGYISTCFAANDSFLTAQQFPKTFDDMSFKSRIEVLRDGYKPYEVTYDDKGNCVSGCAYRGLTIKDDMVAVDEATEEMAELIDAAGTENPINPDDIDLSGVNIAVSGATNWCKNGFSSKLPLRYPVDMTNFKYKITSDFGFREIQKGSKFHPALDIGVPVGTPVYATADGIVDRVWYDDYGGGNVIDIKHENGIITQYMHLSQQLVHSGQTVHACDKIGLSGNTGTSTGPHLDYRIRFQSDKNKYVDILCPNRASNRNTYQSYSINMQNNNDLHSLFRVPYKFRYQSDKHSSWRVEHGHCMTNVNDLLPDETR